MASQTNTLKFTYLTCLFLVFSFLNATGSLITADTDSLFKSDEIINIELRSDFSSVQADRTDKPVYHDCELIYTTYGGETKKLTVKIMVRGHFRRDTANCNFPPLYVNFKKSEVKNTLFDDQDKLKLVTPCQYEKDVIDEYIIYKMYNHVTDRSFKVRLAKIAYFDTSRGKKLFEKYSFFIEDKEHFEKRNQSFEKDTILTPAGMDRENYKRMSVFQYIIGNADWYFTLRHNLLIMQPDNNTLPPYSVPFDFDLSGFVNAEYSKYKTETEKSFSVKRTFNGLCYTEKEFEEIFQFYRGLRPEFESIINNMEHISKTNRKQMTKYIDYFYKVIESPDLIKREFLDVCESTIDFRIKL